jgi:hypothetical protein
MPPELMPELDAELFKLRQLAAARSNSTHRLSLEAEIISR